MRRIQCSLLIFMRRSIASKRSWRCRSKAPGDWQSRSQRRTRNRHSRFICAKGRATDRRQMAPTMDNKWQLYRVNSTAGDEKGAVMGMYQCRGAATRAVAEIAYQPEPGWSCNLSVIGLEGLTSGYRAADHLTVLGPTEKSSRPPSRDPTAVHAPPQPSSSACTFRPSRSRFSAEHRRTE
jgi:hypothetical protein